jgi:hypothetical protein
MFQIHFNGTPQILEANEERISLQYRRHKELIILPLVAIFLTSIVIVTYKSSFNNAKIICFVSGFFALLLWGAWINFLRRPSVTFTCDYPNRQITLDISNNNTIYYSLEFARLRILNDLQTIQVSLIPCERYPSSQLAFITIVCNSPSDDEQLYTTLQRFIPFES